MTSCPSRPLLLPSVLLPCAAWGLFSKLCCHPGISIYITARRARQWPMGTCRWSWSSGSVVPCSLSPSMSRCQLSVQIGTTSSPLPPPCHAHPHECAFSFCFCQRGIPWGSFPPGHCFSWRQEGLRQVGRSQNAGTKLRMLLWGWPPPCPSHLVFRKVWAHST